jgi:hypothetical protein
MMAVIPRDNAGARKPEPRGHLMQAYTEDVFLVGVVADYVARGIVQGGGSVIIATPLHVKAFADRLAAVGIDVPAAIEKSQLIVMDADRTLGRFMVAGVPDRSKFFSVITAALDQVRTAGYRRIRAFGEMVDLLWGRDLEAAIRLEELWNEMLADRRLSLLCAYRIDLLDRRTRGVLHQVTLCHSRLLPAQNSDELELALDRAFTDVFGADDAGALRDAMVSAAVSLPPMPKAPATLISLNDHPDSLANQVFERARHYFLDAKTDIDGRIRSCRPPPE